MLLSINFIDTSNEYGKGTAESFLGEALAGRPRDSYVLGTKLLFAMTATDKGLSAEQIHKQLNNSLRRLRTDYVDLYPCHRFDPDTPLEEIMQVLTEGGRFRQNPVGGIQRMDSATNPGSHGSITTPGGLSW